MTTEIDDPSKAKNSKNDAPKAFGVLMKDAREKAGYSIERAAMSTRITPAFIEALEKENFEILPGAIFGRGFIRSLCRSYGCKAEDMIIAYDQATELRKLSPDSAQPFRENRKIVRVREATGASNGGEWKNRLRDSVGAYYSKGKPFLLIAPLVVLGIYVVQAVYKSNEQAVTPVPESSPAVIAEAPPVVTPPTPAPADAVEVSPSTPSQPATFDGVVRGEGIESVIILVKEPVNVAITRDRDRQITEALRPANYKLQFNEQLKLYVENMASVEIQFKGQTIPPGATGEKRMTFTVSESSLAKGNEKRKL